LISKYKFIKGGYSLKNYINWLKYNWQKSAIMVLIYVLITLVPLYSILNPVQFMILLAFPLYLIHEIEEYILPGGFENFFNNNLLKVSTENKIVPIDEDVVFWINFIYIWLVVPVVAGLSFVNINIALWIPYFFIFQAVAHLVMGIVGKMILNPGIRSSFFLHIPYAIYLIYLLDINNHLTNPYFNIHLVIGFAFNLILPLVAKFIILPRFNNRINKTP
jgi:hypothetical protein